MVVVGHREVVCSGLHVDVNGGGIGLAVGVGNGVPKRCGSHEVGGWRECNGIVRINEGRSVGGVLGDGHRDRRIVEPGVVG